MCCGFGLCSPSITIQWLRPLKTEVLHGLLLGLLIPTPQAPRVLVSEKKKRNHRNMEGCVNLCLPQQ